MTQEGDLSVSNYSELTQSVGDFGGTLRSFGNTRECFQLFRINPIGGDYESTRGAKFGFQLFRINPIGGAMEKYGIVNQEALFPIIPN